MAYLHEQRMMDAVKRLYMLGNRPHREKTEMAGTAGLSAAGQAAIARMRQKSTSKKPDSFKEEMKGLTGEVNKKELSSVGVGNTPTMVSPGPMEKELVQFDADVSAIRAQNPQQVWNPTTEAEQALQFQEINKMQEDMPMGGIYTPQGLQKAEKDATLNAQDRMRLKGLIGSGMRLSQPSMYQPDWAVERAP